MSKTSAWKARRVGLALTGSASIPARELDLRGTASLLSVAASGANAAVPAFELPFMVQGPWDDPIMLPDPQSRIQRSGAARLSWTRSATAARATPVRSAIERLTGAAPSPPAESAPTAPALAGGSDSTESPAPGERRRAKSEPVPRSAALISPAGPARRRTPTPRRQGHAAQRPILRNLPASEAATMPIATNAIR